MPVGHIWKFDLEKHETRSFGRNFNFSKFRMEPVMLNFLATTKNIRKIISEHPIYNRGKVPKKQREIAIRNFQIRNKTRVEPPYPEIGKEAIAKEDHDYSS